MKPAPEILPLPAEWETIKEYFRDFRLHDALTLATSLFVRIEAEGGEGTITHAVALFLLALVHRKFGRFDEALPLLERAVGPIEKYAGEFSEGAAWVASELADVKVCRPEFDPESAAAAIKKELQIHGVLGGERHPYYELGHLHLMRFYTRSDRWDDAERSIIRSLRLCAEHFGKDSMLFVQRLCFLAEVYRRTDRYTMARKALSRAKVIIDKTAAFNDPIYAYWFEDIGRLDECEEDLSSARFHFEIALARASDCFPEDHYLVKRINRCLERVSTSRGDGTSQSTDSPGGLI